MAKHYQSDRVRRDNIERNQAARDHHLNCMAERPFRSSPEEEARLAEEAKNFKVTKCPYAGEPRSQRFDLRSHLPSRKGKRPVTNLLASGSLSFVDYQTGMHIQGRASAEAMRMYYTPEFAASDKLLRLVIAQQAYNYIRSNTPGVDPHMEIIPDCLLEDREILAGMVTATTKRIKDKIPTMKNNVILPFRHVLWCEAHGGYLALRSVIAYRAWREAKDSHTIANELGISWRVVRQILNRLCIVAKRLGLETFPPHHSCFLVHKPIDWDRAKYLKAGKAA